MERRRFIALAAGLPALALVRPASARDIDLALTAAPRAAAPGTWAYNGTVPGPLIEAHEGDRLRILFRNRLPQASTIHWHGLAIPEAQDGSPFHPVAPGADRIYEFTLPEGSAGTYWYHPHVHGTTEEQVARGLLGMLVVHPHHDPLEGLADVPLVISDPLLVNGARRPRLAIAPGETQRWRILNASASRYFRLSLQGRPFTLAGTDGGLLAAPLEGLTEHLLAPAERIEILVASREAAGGSVALQALPYDAGTMGMMGGGMMGGMGMGMGRRTPPGPIDLLELRTVPGPFEARTPPRAYRAIEPLARARDASRFVLTGGMMMSGFAINGRTFDMARIDAESRVGEVQRWVIENASPMDHPFHLHGTQFQVLSAPVLAWKDTVNVRPGQSVTIAFRHDHPGRWMYHCHILAHEDAGMMGVLRVS